MARLSSGEARESPICHGKRRQETHAHTRSLGTPRAYPSSWSLDAMDGTRRTTTPAEPVAGAGKGPDYLRRAAAFGPGNQPPDAFLDPDLRLPPQQLFGLGGMIAQRSLRGGGHRARLVLVDGLEGRARQSQQDLGNVVERRVNARGDHEALPRDLAGHR